MASLVTLTRQVTHGLSAAAIAREEQRLLLDQFPGAGLAFSFRKLRRAYTGSAVRIRRSSDNAELDIGFAANNDFDVAAAAAHIGAGTGNIVTMYDQSGNGDDATNATQATQPDYSATGFNNLPSGSFTTASDVLGTASDAASLGGTQATLIAALTMESATDQFGRYFSFLGTGDSDDNSGAGSFNGQRQSTSNGLQANRGGASLGAISISLSTKYVFASIFDGTNETNYLNGVAGSPSASSGTFRSTGTARVGNSPSGEKWVGLISEVILWPSDLTARVSNLDSSVRAYWRV
jgi:hypothetical protein